MYGEKPAAAACLCILLVGSGGEFVRIASPLCDWHSTACEETRGIPDHIHFDVGSGSTLTSLST